MGVTCAATSGLRRQQVASKAPPLLHPHGNPCHWRTLPLLPPLALAPSLLARLEARLGSSDSPRGRRLPSSRRSPLLLPDAGFAFFFGAAAAGQQAVQLLLTATATARRHGTRSCSQLCEAKA